MMKRYDLGKDIRAIARERIGIVPVRKVLKSRKDKGLKHKERHLEDEAL